MASTMALDAGKDSTSTPARLLQSSKLANISCQTISQASPLLRLPNELLLEIFNHLPQPSQSALQQACRELYHRIPSPRPSMAASQSTCERKARLRTNEEPSNRREGKRRCIMCGVLAPLNYFRWAATPVCNQHDGWFFGRSIPELLEEDLKARLYALPSNLNCWVAFDRRYCAHTKDIIGWHVRDCGCGCEFCGHFAVTCFVKIAETDSRGAELELLDRQGGLEVREHWRGSPVERCLPVVRLSKL